MAEILIMKTTTLLLILLFSINSNAEETVDQVVTESASVTTTVTTPQPTNPQSIPPTNQAEKNTAPVAKKPSPFSSEAFAEKAKTKTTVTTTKFEKNKKTFKAKLAAFLDQINVFKLIDKIQVFLDKTKAQNVSSIEAGESGDFSAVVTKRRFTSSKAKDIQDRLDKIQQEQLKRIDVVE